MIINSLFNIFSGLVTFNVEQDLYFCVHNTIYLVLYCIAEMVKFFLLNSKLFGSIMIFVIVLFVAWLLFYTPSLAKKPKVESGEGEKDSKGTAESKGKGKNSEGSSSGEDESKEGIDRGAEGSSSGDEKSKEEKNKNVKGIDKGTKGSSSLEKNSKESNEISSTAAGGTSEQPSSIVFPDSSYESPKAQSGQPDVPLAPIAGNNSAINNSQQQFPLIDPEDPRLHINSVEPQPGLRIINPDHLTHILPRRK